MRTLRDAALTSLDAIRERFRLPRRLGGSLSLYSRTRPRARAAREAAHNDANKVRGCVSQVWLELSESANAAGETVLHYRGDSDLHLVRGLVAIAIALYSDRTPREILSSDAHGVLSRTWPRTTSDAATLQWRAGDDRPHPRRRRRSRESGLALRVRGRDPALRRRAAFR